MVTDQLPLSFRVPGGRQPRPRRPRRKSQGKFGADKERSLMRRLRDTRGWHCIRAAGSFGPADIVGIRRDGYLLAQCKAGVRRPTPGETRKAMDALRAIPAPPTTRLELHYWSTESRMWETVAREVVE